MSELFSSTWEGVRAGMLTHGVRILIILVAALVAYRVSGLIIGRIQATVEDADPDTKSDLEKRTETLGRIVKQISLAVITLVSVMLVMKELGFDIGPMIAGAGIAGLAIGFGAQNLVRDIITGFFILLENQFRVGDVVEIAGKSGLVEAVNLRTTVLRDLEGRVHIVPNGIIGAVTNKTRGWSRAVLDVGVAYSEDVGRVMEELKNIGETMEKDPVWSPKLLEPLSIPGVNELADSAVVIRVMFKTRPHNQGEVVRELRRRIKNRFDELGIELPFPHMTVYVGLGGQGVIRHAPHSET